MCIEIFSKHNLWNPRNSVLKRVSHNYIRYFTCDQGLFTRIVIYKMTLQRRRSFFVGKNPQSVITDRIFCVRRKDLQGKMSSKIQLIDCKHHVAVSQATINSHISRKMSFSWNRAQYCTRINWLSTCNRNLECCAIQDIRPKCIFNSNLEISFVQDILFSRTIVLKFCTKHDSITAVLYANF